MATSSHVAQRLKERYKLHVTPELITEICERIRKGEGASCLYLVEDSNRSVWKVMVRNRLLRVVVSVTGEDQVELITALPYGKKLFWGRAERRILRERRIASYKTPVDPALEDENEEEDEWGLSD